MTTSDGIFTHSDQVRTVGFLLIDGFPLLAYAAGIEPLRAANQLTGRELYRWRHYSIDGYPVRASNGIRLMAEHRAGAQSALDILLLCAGSDAGKFEHTATFAWLRQLARPGRRIGGVSGGPFILARAGLLNSSRCTIHWEQRAAFSRTFPGLDLTSAPYVVDGDRLTCGGGLAPLQMMVEVIAADHGRALATAAGEWHARSEVSPGEAKRRAAARERFGVGSEALVKALALMTDNLEAPLRRDRLAAAAGLSPRQVERLFLRELKSTPAAFHQRLRLERARELLREDRAPMAEVARACGFVAPAHFSRAYRAAFGQTPSEDRSGKAKGAETEVSAPQAEVRLNA